MKKIVKVVGLCSRPLQARYLAATDEERRALVAVVEGESGWIIERMRAKGYEMEATVGQIYGIFTRGHGRGSICLPGQPAQTR